MTDPKQSIRSTNPRNIKIIHMKYFPLFLLASCSLITDPVLDKDVMELGEEVIKDELGIKKKVPIPVDVFWCEESDQKPSSDPAPIVNFPFRGETSIRK